jgi:hypothetical protein
MELSFEGWGNECGTESQNSVVNCSSHAGGFLCKDNSDDSLVAGCLKS